MGGVVTAVAAPERDEAGAAVAAVEAERDRALTELHVITVAWDVAVQALQRIHDRAAISGDSSLVTITEHALRAERWESPLWVCALCEWTSSESEPCPQHGHTGAPWCCDACREAGRG